ncbi:MAG: hypothetical protein HYV97_01025, partial [Bdellovibrio sp.]|nr:hypothetical protein [Bdellovibrio sp.]
MKILLCFFLVNLLLGQTEAQTLKCSKNGTDVYYLNGIKAYADQAGASKEHLRDRVVRQHKAEIDYWEKTDVKLMYNPTQGIIFDLSEFMGQKLQEAGVSNVGRNLAKLIFQSNSITYGVNRALTDVKQLKNAQLEFDTSLILGHQDVELPTLINARNLLKQSFDAGRKVIVVSHSQGNLFANQLYDMISVDPDFLEFLPIYGNLQIATPATAILTPNGDYITLAEDMVISKLPTARPANFQLSDYILGTTYFAGDFTGHGMSEIYLSAHSATPINAFTPENPMHEIIADKLIKRAEFLADNCPTTFSGTVEVSDTSINLGDSLTVKITPSNEDDGYLLHNASKLKWTLSRSVDGWSEEIALQSGEMILTGSNGSGPLEFSVRPNRTARTTLSKLELVYDNSAQGIVTIPVPISGTLPSVAVRGLVRINACADSADLVATLSPWGTLPVCPVVSSIDVLSGTTFQSDVSGTWYETTNLAGSLTFIVTENPLPCDFLTQYAYYMTYPEVIMKIYWFDYSETQGVHIRRPAQAALDLDGIITEFSWSMGDGTILSGAQIIYTYAT